VSVSSRLSGQMLRIVSSQGTQLRASRTHVDDLYTFEYMNNHDY